MKSEKGITLTSLIIYIIGLLVAITIITVVSSFFYESIDISTETIDTLSEFTKFNSFFTQQINKDSIEFVNCQTNRQGDTSTGKITESYAIFSDGTQYSYIAQNKSIYEGNVKIAEQVEDCEFSLKVDETTGKEELNVRIKFLESEIEKQNSYIIN